MTADDGPVRFELAPFRDLPWLARRVSMLQTAAVAVVVLGVVAAATPAGPWVALAGSGLVAAVNLGAAWGLSSARLTVSDEAIVARSRLRRVRVPLACTARIEVTWRAARGAGPAVVALDADGRRRTLPSDAIAGLAHVRGARWRERFEGALRRVCAAHSVDLSIDPPRWVALLRSHS